MLAKCWRQWIKQHFFHTLHYRTAQGITVDTLKWKDMFKTPCRQEKVLLFWWKLVKNQSSLTSVRGGEDRPYHPLPWICHWYGIQAQWPKKGILRCSVTLLPLSTATILISWTNICNSALCSRDKNVTESARTLQSLKTTCKLYPQPHDSLDTTDIAAFAAVQNVPCSHNM